MADNVTTVQELVVDGSKKSSLRRPRNRALINGVEFIPISGSVTRNNNFQANTFEMSLPLFGEGSQPLEFWSEETKFEVDIQQGFEEKGSVTWKTIQKGIVDAEELDLTGFAIQLSGRDKTALFLDNKTYDA